MDARKYEACLHESPENQPNVSRSTKGSYSRLSIRDGVYKPPPNDPTTSFDESTKRYRGWTSGKTITFYTIGSEAIRQMNFYHEFGHLINNATGNEFTDGLEGLEDPSFINQSRIIDTKALKVTRVKDPNFPQGVEAIQHESTFASEQWADIFANYVAGNIDQTPGSIGYDMYDFVTTVLDPYDGGD